MFSNQNDDEADPNDGFAGEFTNNDDAHRDEGDDTELDWESACERLAKRFNAMGGARDEEAE